MLEKELTPEQIARMYMDIIDKTFAKEISTQEAEIEIERFKDLYVEPMDYRTWVKFMLEKNELEQNRWAYTYFKEVVVSLDYKIAFFQQSLALIIAYQSHEDSSISGFKEAWTQHCKEHPEDKEMDEERKRHIERFKKLDIGELLDKISELEKQRADILNWDEGWEKMGYPKPSSVFDTSPQSEQKE
jgi:hypothetical protein